MIERGKWVQTSLYQRGPFRGMKKDEIDVYIPKKEPVYWIELPWRISISRANILNQQEDNLTAAIGKEREIVVFERKRGPDKDYHYRPIENYWYPRGGITLFPEQIKGLGILEGEELEKATVEEIGGKAKGLLRLKELEGLGFKVPKFFVIPTSFYHRLNDAFGFEGRAEDVMATYTPDEIAREDIFFSSRQIPTEVRDLFDKLGYWENFNSLIWPKMAEWFNWQSLEGFHPLYFRSSSPLEDGREYTFPGVFESSLASDRQFIYEGLKRILLSPWTAYAEHYLRARGLAGKVSRAMAVIVQEVPRDIRITGRIFFNGDSLTVEYVRGLTQDGSYLGNKIIIDRDLNIIEKINSEGKNLGMVLWEQEESLTDEEARRLASLTLELDKELRDFKGQFNLEFALGEEQIYLLQARPTIRAKRAEAVNLEEIDPQDIITRVQARFRGNFSVGRPEGPVINLLKVDPRVYSEEWISSIDRQFPGAIYIVSFYNTENNFSGETQWIDHYQIVMDEKGHLLTPRKAGMIVCSPKFHDHFTEALQTDPCFFIFGPLEDFIDIPTGMRIGIESDGKTAIIYKCEESPRAEKEIQVTPEAEKPKGKRYYGFWNIYQPSLPGLRDFIGSF